MIAAVFLWRILLNGLLFVFAEDCSTVVRARVIAVRASDKNAPRMAVSVATKLILVWTRIHNHFLPSIAISQDKETSYINYQFPKYGVLDNLEVPGQVNILPSSRNRMLQYGATE